MAIPRALFAALLSTALLVTTAVLSTGPAEAAPKVGFTKLYADSPGTDRGSNRSLNGEYVVVRNNTKKAIKLAGYRVKDKAGHTFVFGKGFVLKGKKSVTIRTGKGRNSRSTLYWKQGWYVWNNTTDTARLINRNGKRVDSCTYNSKKTSRPYTKC